MLTYLAENNTISQQKLADYLLKQTGCLVSQSTISRLLQRERITYKKTTPYFLEQRPLLGEIRQFINIIELLPSRQLIFLDECSFYWDENPRYGYAPRGQRAFTWKLGNCNAHYNLILCLCNAKKRAVVHYQIIKGGVKTQKFHSFLSEIKLPTGDKYYLLMDNLSVHKAEKTCQELGLTTVKELLLSQEHYSALFASLYSPIESGGTVL